MKLMIPKRKLRATAARRVSQPRVAEEDAEPTMKLSSAFVVVVILHLVAVGGIYTFESIKAHRPASAQAEAESQAALPEPVPPSLPVAPGAASRASLVASNAPAAAPAPAQTLKAQTTQATLKTPETRAAAETPKKTAAAAPAGPRDSGSIHTVVAGENPVSIARKLGVDYEDLLKLNRIEDPRKLQIGQKLHIPAKSRTAAN